MNRSGQTNLGHARPSRRRGLARAALVYVVTATAVYGAATVAMANPYEIYGASTRIQGMGGAGAAAADDGSAAWHNPALLGFMKSGSAAVGFTMARPELKLNGAAAASGSNHTGLALNVVVPLPFKGLLRNRFTVGASILLPTTGLASLPGIDDTQPYWVFHQGAADRFIIVTSMGIRIEDWVSIGAGVSILADAGGRISLDLRGVGSGEAVEGLTRSTRLNTTSLDLAYRLAPVVGVLFKPLPQMRLGLNWRGRQAVDVTFPASIIADTQGTTINAVLDLRAFDNPHSLTFGFAYDLATVATFTLDFQWQQYSTYKPPFTSVSVLDNTGAVAGSDTVQPAGFADRWSVRGGAEVKPLDWLRVRGGLGWTRSPVPAQTGESNYLDADTITGTLGLGFHFWEDPDVFKHGVDFDLAGSVIGFASNAYEKDPKTFVDVKNPGWPSISSSGFVWTVGSQLTVRF